MRRSNHLPTILSLLSIISRPVPVNSSPFPVQVASHFLLNRSCEKPCGYYGQVCCSASESCSTDSNGQAVCQAGSSKREDNDGKWEYWTTTFVQTDLVTVTSTGSRKVASPTSDSKGECKDSLGETSCGGVCCSAAQQCVKSKCVEAGGSPFPTSSTASATPPLRPTSETTATATVPFVAPVGTDGNSLEGITQGGGGLSGGAIAGIVIGSLAGAFILLFLCLCFCVAGFMNRVRGIFGMKKKRRHDSSSYSYSYSGSSSRHSHGWFGRPSRPKPEKESSGLFGMGKWASFGAIVALLAVCLGMRRKKNDDSEKTTTYYTGSSYYTYSSRSSSSSSSHHRR